MAVKVLIVEDDVLLAKSVAYAFRREGFEPQIAHDAREALSAAKSLRPALIILDLILPDMDGLELCGLLRKIEGGAIIMLTARSEEVDRIVGLEVGADDYMVKPFSMRELLARARAVLRRTLRMAAPQSVLRCGDLTIDLERHQVTLKGRTLDLTLKEFQLLHLLAEHAGRVLPREVIFQRVWGEPVSPDTRTLDVHIHWLREKIEEEPGHPQRLLTVRGVGYRLVPSNTNSAPEQSRNRTGAAPNAGATAHKAA